MPGRSKIGGYFLVAVGWHWKNLVKTCCDCGSGERKRRKAAFFPRAHEPQKLFLFLAARVPVYQFSANP
jgi:hypothetical protein